MCPACGMGRQGGAPGARSWGETCPPGQPRLGRWTVEGRKADQTQERGAGSEQVSYLSVLVIWLATGPDKVGQPQQSAAAGSG